jgi:hypothetical protein
MLISDTGVQHSIDRSKEIKRLICIFNKQISRSMRYAGWEWNTFGKQVNKKFRGFHGCEDDDAVFLGFGAL